METVRFSETVASSSKTQPEDHSRHSFKGSFVFCKAISFFFCSESEANKTCLETPEQLVAWQLGMKDSHEKCSLLGSLTASVWLTNSAACYSNPDKIACVKVTEKSYNVATRTADLRRVKRAQISQRSKASSAILLT
jgi:hypothetical protein